MSTGRCRDMWAREAAAEVGSIFPLHRMNQPEVGMIFPVGRMIHSEGRMIFPVRRMIHSEGRMIFPVGRMIFPVGRMIFSMEGMNSLGGPKADDQRREPHRSSREAV